MVSYLLVPVAALAQEPVREETGWGSFMSFWVILGVVALVAIIAWTVLKDQRRKRGV